MMEIECAIYPGPFLYNAQYCPYMEVISEGVDVNVILHTSTLLREETGNLRKRECPSLNYTFAVVIQ